MKSIQFSQWFIQFLKEVRYELGKIEWPSFDEFIGATIVSLIIVTIFALYFGAVDRVISLIAEQIFAAV